MIRCGVCGGEQSCKSGKTKESKLPPGWKRIGDPEVIWCRDCWKQHWVIRAIEIPVVGPIDGKYSDFEKAIEDGWRAATDVSNWAVTELARNDKPAVFGQEKLESFAKPYLYPGAIAVANPVRTKAKAKGKKKPDPAVDLDAPSSRIAPSSVVSVLHAIEGRYAKRRHETMFLHESAHPVYSYPQPLPFHKESWWCEEGPGGRPCVSVTLGGQRWSLALNAARRKPQMVGWRSILSGRAIQGELVLRRIKAEKSDHRQHIEDREPGGGRRQVYRVMAKLVAYFPRQKSKDLDGTMYCWTSPDHFLNYRIGVGGFIHRLDAQHVVRWVAEHRRRLQGMSNDLKHEKRWPKNVRQQSCERLEIWTEKQRDRLDTFSHEASAILAKFAERNRVAEIVYDDTCKSYVSSFPWSSLATKLQYKVGQRGILLATSKIDELSRSEAGEEISVAS